MKFKKKTDGQEWGEAEESEQSPVIEGGGVGISEGVRNKVGSETRKIPEAVKEVMKMLNEAINKIPKITNYEEAIRLKEETGKKVGESRGREISPKTIEFLELIDDKIGEIYGVEISGHENSVETSEGYHYPRTGESHLHKLEDRKLSLMGFKYDEGYYEIFLEKGASVVVSFANGKTIVFDNYKDVARIKDTLLAQAESVSVNLQIANDEK